MAMTLVEAAKLTRNMLVRGVIETIITESEVLRHLPFLTVVGSGVTYNREKTTGTAAFYAVGDTWNESTPTFDSITAGLKIMGGDADLDEFIAQTYANEQDIRAIIIAEKAKSVAYKFNDGFFNGDSGSDPNTYDGLKKLCGTVENTLGYTGAKRACSDGANGAVLTLDQVDTLVDAVMPGKPDVLFMSKRTRRKLSSLRRASGNILEITVDAFGRRVTMYDGIPIAVDDNIADNEVQGASGAVCSSVYGAKFGYKTGVMGLQNGGITVEPIGTLETKDARRWRIKWYCGLALFRTVAIARLAGVKIS